MNCAFSYSLKTSPPGARVLRPTNVQSASANLSLLLIVAGAVASVCIGYYGGLAFQSSDSTTSSEDAENVSAITLAEDPQSRSSIEPIRISYASRFGLHDHSSFSESEGRLDELLQRFAQISGNHLNQSSLKKEQLLEEIESILALADETQLRQFLENIGPDSGDQSQSLFTAGLVALARLSERSAADAWSNFPHAIPAWSSLIPVMSDWLEKNPSEMQSWIDEQDGELKRLARAAYFVALARKNPQRVLTEIETYDEMRVWDSSGGGNLASVLGHYLDEGSLLETANQILRADEASNNNFNMTGSFVFSWAQRDPESALDWLLTQNLETIGWQNLNHAFTPIMAEAPTEFLEKIAPSLAEMPGLEQVAGRAWWVALGNDEEEAAMAWLAENLDVATDFGGYRIADFASDADEWSPERTARVLESLDVLPRSDARDAFLQDFLERLARYQPEVVLPYAIELLPLGSQSGQTIASAVGHWAKESPEEAIQWTMDNFPTESGRGTAIRFAVSRWTESDPLAATEFALGLPDKYRGDALWGISYNWAEKDPKGVVEYLKSVEDPIAVTSLTKGAFRHFSEHHQPRRHLDLALEMPQGKLRNDAVRGVFGGWALSAPKDALPAIAEIKEGPMKNAAITGFNEYAGRHYPLEAIDLATQITAPNQRDREILFRARSWLKSDRKAAEAAIRSHPGITDEVKAELFP